MPRKIYLAVICVLTLSYSAFGVSPQPPNGNNTTTKSFEFNNPVQIPTNATSIEISFNVQGIETNVWDIDLQTFIEHVNPDELTITLQAPNGKEVTLMSNEGKTIQETNNPLIITYHQTASEPPSQDDIQFEKPLPLNYDKFPIENFTVFHNVLNGTLWDDQADLPVTQAKYSFITQSTQPALQPEGALENFRGINPNGQWKLTITDKAKKTFIEGIEVWKEEKEFITFQPNIEGKVSAHFGVVNWMDLNLSGYDYVQTGADNNFDYWDAFFTWAKSTTIEFNSPDEQKLTKAILTITTLNDKVPFKHNTIVVLPSEDQIPDPGVASFNVTVTNLGTNLKNLQLYAQASHASSEELTISLTSPSQKTVILSHNNGDQLKNIFDGTLWNDLFTTPVGDAPYQDLVALPTLIPEGKLSAFRGENPNGEWTLTVTDSQANNSGKMNRWELYFTTYLDPVEPPALPVPQAPKGITTTTFSYTNALPVPIENFQETQVEFNVNGLPGEIWDMNLQTFINHPSTKDLVIKLYPPFGEALILSTTNGYGHGPFAKTYLLQQNINQPNNLPAFPFKVFVPAPYDNIFNDAIWDDQAEVPATDDSYDSNMPRYQIAPESAFDRFRGKNPNGLWKLSIFDGNGDEPVKGIQKWLDGDSANQDSVVSTIGSLAKSVLQITTATGKAVAKEVTFTKMVEQPLNDNDTTVSELQVDGIGNLIEQIKVFTKIPHPKTGQLDIQLTSPSGKTVTLSTGNGQETSNGFDGTLWDDRVSSDLRVTAASFADNQVHPLLAPEGSLALFRGENPNGTWLLKVRDNKNGDIGELKEWNLQISSYFSSLPPIDGFPHNPKPLPPSNFTKGKDYVFGQKGKVAYLLKQEDGKSLSAPITLGNLPAKHKIVAANHFAIPGHSNQVVCVILQNKTQLFAKAVGANGSSFSDAALTLPTFTDRKDKLVASGDVNRDGFNDLVIQGRRKSVQALLGPEFSPVPLTNIFKKYGKIVGVADGKILTRKKGLLYATTIGIESNGFTSTTTLIGNGLKSSLKIRGVADILKKPGLELITQEGNKIGYGPLNLNGSFGYLHTNRTDLTLGKAAGPK